MPARDDEPMAGGAGTAPSWDAASDQGGYRHSFHDQGRNGPGSWPGQDSQADQATRPVSGSATQQDWRARVSHGFLARLVRGPGSRLPLRREREGRLAGGVMAGISTKTGVDVTALRVTLVVITLLSSGIAAAAYVVAWLLLPFAGDSANIASRAVSDRRGIGIVALIASILGVVLVVASVLDAGWLNAVAWPMIISVCGIVLIWRNADPDEQALLHRLAGPVFTQATAGAKERLWLRVLITAALIGCGLVFLVHGRHHTDLLPPLGGILLVLAGTAVALGPWWMRVARDLVDERQARIRAEERADMAARVHDSVLQTLALIQRRASEPQQVIQLARGQERELRAWLFDDQAPGTIKGEGVTLAAGIKKIQQDVETQHRIAVDAVTVGDCELDEDLEATLGAAREATVNAAKWSGSDTVSLFAEVEPEAVSIFVRDRGRGFDPDAVSGDRKGLAESVRARMSRRGGSAMIRSAPGEGTEVTLTMPRSSSADQSLRRS
jgi:signal transduction histidine kinase